MPKVNCAVVGWSSSTCGINKWEKEPYLDMETFAILSDIGKYFSSFFVAIVIVAVISILIL